ncbi:uncharacterized protein LOC131018903 [Salvia miltiorrhiza]|uniref:uncharacterized protein LOC131018903 n=1 Tax=Salvia miltiorrhiza TaxID=226208 RepID=UPI0025AC55BA|nr:uncharacterized protein LOC131018903 [Salvia miltiorrhiza]
MGRANSGRWFMDNIRRRIGNGSQTKFWEHKWAGSTPLRMTFPRLFQLATDKEATVGEWGKWVDGEWIWEFKWRREIRASEQEMVDRLTNFISQCVPCADREDCWTWLASSDGKFSTKSTYSILKAYSNVLPRPNADADFLNLIWKAKTPHKATMTTWRMLKNRLPTCENLRKRKILMTDEATKCCECDMQEESTNHFFLLCPKTDEVWNELQKWLGIVTARPNHFGKHFGMFISFGKEKKIRNLLLAIWVGCIWIMWKKRNERRFDGKLWDSKNFVLEIKIRLWFWNMIFEIVEDAMDLDAWCSNDFICKLL